MHMNLGPDTRVTHEIDDIPVSTRWHRAHGRQSRRERAVHQQLLTPPGEKALVDHVLRLYRNGHPARIKHLREFARILLRRRARARGLCSPRLPGKDWPQAFHKRHPELQAARLKAIDWQRHEKNIRAKVERWFDIMKIQLSERDVLQENVYNMDETGVLLSDLSSVKVLIARGDQEKRRGVGLKRTQITAVECISADGRCLPPLIIFPAKTLRSTWVSYETPDWHYACSDSGYMNSELNLYWVKNVFDPATRARAEGKSRILIVDGFTTHESIDVLTFCFENNITICRQPSHATHKLQPCDVGIFSPLKTAYREQVEQLYRMGAGTVNKAHFAMLYSRARVIAMTPRNIRSGWSKTGLYPFNPSKVLDDMQDIPAETSEEITTSCVTMQPLASPLSLRTPTDVVSLVALQRKLEEGPESVADTNPYLQKLLNAARRAIDGKEKADAENELLLVQNQELTQANNEKKTRQRVVEKKIGEAKVMSYADIAEARAAQGRKDAEKEKRKAAKKTPKKTPKRKQKHQGEEMEGGGAIEPNLGAEAGIAGMQATELSAHCSLLSTQRCAQGDASKTSCFQSGGGIVDVPHITAWPVEGYERPIQWQVPVARMY